MKMSGVFITMLLLALAYMTLGAAAQKQAPGNQEDERMNESISWIFEATIKPGSIDQLKAMIVEMADRTEETEAGTLRYEWMISDDNRSAQVHERYRDSAAALTHLASFNENYAERLMMLVDPTGMTVFGSPSEALKKELSGVAPVYMHKAGGFVRELD